MNEAQEKYQEKETGGLMTDENHKEGGIPGDRICVFCWDDWPCDYIRGKQAGYRKAIEEVGVEHKRLERCEEGRRHTFEQDWDALGAWLDAKIKEVGHDG